MTGIQLYPHQEEGARFLAEHKRAGLFYEVGLGKTYSALRAAREPVLVVCPRYLRYMWRDAIWAYLASNGVDAHDPLDGRPMVKVVDGSADARHEALSDAPHGAAFYIVNYQMLRLGAASSATTAKYAELFAARWGTVIFDEAHNMRARNAYWKGAKKLKGERRYLLTGTPMVTNWGDVWPLLALIDGKTYHSYWAFVNEHLKTFTTPYATDIGALRDEDGFGKLLDAHFLRHDYASAKRPVPEYVEQDIPTALTRATRDKMKRARETFWREHKTANGDIEQVPIKSVAGLALALRQITAEDPEKMDTLLELVSDHAGCGGMIIWAWFKETAERIHARLCAEYEDAALVHGALPDKRRDEAVARFAQRGGLMVATLASLSEGANLQVAPVQAFFEAHYLGTTNRQAIGRSARTGQDKIVRVYYIVGERSPDTRVLKVARERSAQADAPWRALVTEDEG